MTRTAYPAHPLRDFYWMALDEHQQSNGIVGSGVRDLAREGDYAGALVWFGLARRSDFRTRPFRGL